MKIQFNGEMTAVVRTVAGPDPVIGRLVNYGPGDGITIKRPNSGRTGDVTVWVPERNIAQVVFTPWTEDEDG